MFRKGARVKVCWPEDDQESTPAHVCDGMVGVITSIQWLRPMLPNISCPFYLAELSDGTSRWFTDNHLEAL